MSYISTSLFLLLTLVLIVCGIYPFGLWCVGQTLFPYQANGSMLHGPDGKIVGSKLIAQAFTNNEYFQPRPSAAAYDASASASSALAASNYALRNRVARSLGPIVKYIDGQSVAPDIEKWFQENTFNGTPGIVAQWATMHSSLAQAWVNADPTHAAFVAQFFKDNLTITKPTDADLAVVFFQNFAVKNPGKFPLSTGTDIQAIFFDMWRQDHKDARLQSMPADMVTTSASGLDPHITLVNAELQLERVAAAWAVRLKKDPNSIAAEIKQMLNTHAQAPFAGLIGETIVNVLELNLDLQHRYG